MRLLPFVLLALSGPPAGPARVAPAASAVTSTCPVDVTRARANVTKFLTSDNLAAEREQIGMASAGSASLRLLTDASDATLCQRLAAAVHLGPGRYPRVSTYYTAGGFYFVATTYVVPSDRLWISHEPLLVFDGNLNYLGSYAM